MHAHTKNTTPSYDPGVTVVLKKVEYHLIVPCRTCVVETISEDYAKSTWTPRFQWKISEKKRRRCWMEGLPAPTASRNFVNHHLGCSCEYFMLRWFAQLLLSSEIRRFYCGDCQNCIQTYRFTKHFPCRLQGK